MLTLLRVVAQVQSDNLAVAVAVAASWSCFAKLRSRPEIFKLL
jgi:hypothetical protein